MSYDCETTGLFKTDTVVGISVCAEEDKAFYIVLHEWLGTSLVNIPYSNIEYFMKDLQGKKLICHNAVFDCMMAESYFGVNLIDSLHTDTMILAHLLDENRRVGLKELGKAYFGSSAEDESKIMKEGVIANGGKLTKDCFEMYKADSNLLAKYGAQDALLTYKLFTQLVPELYEQGLEKFFYEEESMPLLKGPTYQLNTTGLKVDQQGLLHLKKQLQAECAEAKDFISSEIASQIKDKYPGTTKKNIFNIGSSQQLSWLIFGKYNLEFNTLTKEGKNVCKILGLRLPYTQMAKRDFIDICTNQVGEVYTQKGIVNGKEVKGKKIKEPWAYIACDKKTLTKLAPEYKWIERLLEYQRKTKLLTTYVEGFEERLKYGILQGSFLQHGTTSGRYASRSPNMQNIPREDKRIKNVLIARPGKVFVGSDFSQLEVRVFASRSNDKALLDSFKTGEDFYSAVGIKVWGKYDATPYKDGSPDAFGIKYKKLRDQAKVIALASTYGASARQLSPTTGKSVEDTQEDIDTYFREFPGVATMMTEAHKTVKEVGQVTSLFGRPRRIPEAKRINKLYGNVDHSELPYEARNMLNLAVNHSIQSTAASICNRSMIKFCNNVAEIQLKDCYIVMQVHDEIIVECKEEDAETVSLLLQDAMETAVELPGVSLEAIPHTAKDIGSLK